MNSLRLTSPDAIKAGALELLAVDPSVSLAEVAARAGVGRATLHRYFPTRTDLIRALALEALDATDAACRHLASASSGRAALAEMFEALIPLGPQYAFLARCPVDDPDVKRRYAEQIESLRELVEVLRNEGQLAADVPTPWAVGLIDQLIWTAWSLVARGEVAPRTAAALAVRSVLEGLGGEAR